MPAAPFSTLTHEQLDSTFREFYWLAKAGVPLEPVLRVAGDDLNDRTGRVLAALGEHLASGKSLSTALAEAVPELPAAYRAILEAGLRSGNLPEALEQSARVARATHELREGMVRVAWYPWFVVIVTLVIATALVPGWGTWLEEFSQVQRVPLGWLAASVVWLGEVISPAGFIVAALIAVGGLAFFLASQFAPWSLAGRLGAVMRWFPGARALWKNMQTMLVARLLSMLLRAGVPLHEAVVLAVSATGDARLLQHAERWSASHARGEVGGRDAQSASNSSATLVSPVVDWLLNGRQDGSLPAILDRLADEKQNEAQFQLRMVEVILPVAAMMLVAGVVVLLFCLTIVGSFWSILPSMG